MVALLLATNVENVNVEEPFDRGLAQILLDVSNELSISDITSSQFIDVVKAAVAAGVGVEFNSNRLRITATISRDSESSPSMPLHS